MGKGCPKRLLGGLAALAVAVGLALALWALLGPSQSPTPVDRAALKESVAAQVTPAAEAKAPGGGGTADASRVQESLEYIIRDASGKVKEQKSIGGPR